MIASPLKETTLKLAYNAVRLGRKILPEQKKVRILVVHGVHDKEMERQFPPPAGSIPFDQFQLQIECLKRIFTFVTLDDLAQMAQGETAWKENSIILTFDDSLKCLIKLAAPFLQSVGVKGTFYLSTKALDDGRPYWWRRLDFLKSCKKTQVVRVLFPNEEALVLNAPFSYEVTQDLKKRLKLVPANTRDSIISEIEDQLGMRVDPAIDPHAEVMNWNDAKKLSNLGMCVGSHSVTHPNLALINAEELKHEVEISKLTLEKNLNVKCNHFCYPYGSYSQAVVEAAAAAGYKTAVTTQSPGVNSVSDKLHSLKRSHLPKDPKRLIRFLLPNG